MKHFLAMTVATILLASSELAGQTGPFQYRGTTQIRDNPVAVVSEDFNQDGNKDLAIVLMGSASVLVMIGNGDGSFQSPANYATGRNPGSIVAGDWNGDGKTDLAVVCQGLGSEAAPEINILIGTGYGSFLRGTSLPVNGGPGALASADFNSDGRADLVVSYGSNSEIPYTVFLAEGNGSFKAVVPVIGGSTREPVTQLQSRGVGDFNGDGRLDLVLSPRVESWRTAHLAPRITDILAIALGNGDGTFLPAQRLRPRPFTDDVDGMSGVVAIAAADFDGDGVLDLAVLDDRDELLLEGALLLLRGNGEGGFHPVIARPFDFNGPATMAACDINSDKIPDLVVPQFSSALPLFFFLPGAQPQGAALWTFEGNGNGSFRTTKDTRFSASLSELGKVIHCADLNNDGKPDLVFLNTDTAYIWLNVTPGAASGSSESTRQQTLRR